MPEISRVAARRKRHRRVRKKILGTAEKPRLAVYRSNRQIYAQLIDDFAGRTLAYAASLGNGDKGDPKERAKAVGRDLAGKAKKVGISTAIFDRGGFKYHGRVQAVAEGAREGGLDL